MTQQWRIIGPFVADDLPCIASVLVYCAMLQSINVVVLLLLCFCGIHATLDGHGSDNIPMSLVIDGTWCKIFIHTIASLAAKRAYNLVRLRPSVPEFSFSCSGCERCVVVVRSIRWPVKPGRVLVGRNLTKHLDKRQLNYVGYRLALQQINLELKDNLNSQEVPKSILLEVFDLPFYREEGQILVIPTHYLSSTSTISLALRPKFRFKTFFLFVFASQQHVLHRVLFVSSCVYMCKCCAW